MFKEDEDVVIIDSIVYYQGEAFTGILIDTINQVTARTHYKYGKRHGKGTIYYEDGTIYQTGNFLKGQKHGEFNIYYPNGQIIQKSNFKYNLRNGLLKEWSNKGVLIFSGGFSKNVKNGIFKYYFDNGTQKKYMAYSNGFLCFSNEYDSLGKLKNAYNYFRDTIVKNKDGNFEFVIDLMIRNKSFEFIDFSYAYNSIINLDTINLTPNSSVRLQLDTSIFTIPFLTNKTGRYSLRTACLIIDNYEKCYSVYDIIYDINSKGEISNKKTEFVPF